MNRFKLFPALLALVLFGCAAHNPIPPPVPPEFARSQYYPYLEPEFCQQRGLFWNCDYLLHFWIQ